jgi:hypothetical protein
MPPIECIILAIAALLLNITAAAAFQYQIEAANKNVSTKELLASAKHRPYIEYSLTPALQEWYVRVFDNGVIVLFVQGTRRTVSVNSAANNIVARLLTEELPSKKCAFRFSEEYKRHGVCIGPTQYKITLFDGSRRAIKDVFIETIDGKFPPGCPTRLQQLVLDVCPIIEPVISNQVGFPARD